MVLIDFVFKTEAQTTKYFIKKFTLFFEIYKNPGFCF